MPNEARIIATMTTMVTDLIFKDTWTCSIEMSAERITLVSVSDFYNNITWSRKIPMTLGVYLSCRAYLFHFSNHTSLLFIRTCTAQHALIFLKSFSSLFLFGMGRWYSMNPGHRCSLKISFSIHECFFYLCEKCYFFLLISIDFLFLCRCDHGWIST